MEEKYYIYSLDTEEIKEYSDLETFLDEKIVNEDYLEELYNECFEDVELNLNCILNGKINITDSKAVAIHHESISRGKTKEANDRLMLDYQTNLKPFIDNNIKKLDKYFKVVNN